MVTDVVSNVIIKVHQSLHGYSDGHRQLACSVKLSQDDAKLVLTMSDISGAGVSSDGGSYLTGYPLKDTGMYALAKTWSAPEMPRPGCVWTHTVYIDYADLATVMAPSRLTKLFRRPESASWPSYGMPASTSVLDFDEAEPKLSFQDEQWLTSVLFALYGAPRERVAAKCDPSVSVDALTLRIWDQQWPRLRRSFRFCTLTTKDRSMPSAAFDLQVLPSNEPSSRMQYAGILVATPSSDSYHSDDWLVTLMDDARQPNLDRLRDTLRQLGADILGGREAMSTFCEFHRATSGVTSLSNLHQAMNILDGQGFLSQSDVARGLLVKHILSVVEIADNRALEFIWNNWRFVDTEQLSNSGAQLQASLWRAFPERLLADLCGNVLEKANWAAEIIRSLDSKDLLDGWPNADVPWRRVLTYRPDLLDMSAFWKRIEVRAPSDLHGLELSDVGVDALISGMDRITAMGATVQWLGSLRVLDALQQRSRRPNWMASELRWVSLCIRDTSAIADFLSRVQEPSLLVVQELANQLDPDAVPNQHGDDPWFTALLRLREAHDTLPPSLVAYGFARALSRKSRSVAELMQLTFEPLHAVAASSMLDDGAWQLIEQRLPWVWEKKLGNRSQRLTKIVAEVFVSRRLWPLAFARMTENTDLYVALMEETVELLGGKRFLKSVEESLEDEQDSATQERRELIHKFLRQDRSK